MTPMFLLLFIVIVLVVLGALSGRSPHAGDTTQRSGPARPPVTATRQVYVRHGDCGRALAEKNRILCQPDRDVSASRDDGDDGIHPNPHQSPSGRKSLADRNRRVVNSRRAGTLPDRRNSPPREG